MDLRGGCYDQDRTGSEAGQCFARHRVFQDLEQSTLEAVRKFVDTVDGQFPDLREDGPRHKIIDSAFKMVEQMVNASNKLARNMVSVTENALAEFDKNASSP